MYTQAKKFEMKLTDRERGVKLPDKNINNQNLFNRCKINKHKIVNTQSKYLY